MKRVFSFVLVFFSVHLLFGQQKEWQNLLQLLQKEAAYFQGKSGFIQLMKSDHNIFSIEKFTINDSLVVSKMWLGDRFDSENPGQYLEERIVLEPELSIVSTEIYYDFSYYFENFPETQFLLLKINPEFPVVHQTVSISKDQQTGKENRTEMEGTTEQILIPIRIKSRKKIFKAIDRYQRTTLKQELELDRRH